MDKQAEAMNPPSYSDTVAQPGIQAYSMPAMPAQPGVVQRDVYTGTVQGFVQPPSGPATTVIHQQVPFVPAYGPQPLTTTCPNCKEQIQTQIEQKTSGFAYILAGVICIVGFWCGCCLIPLAMDSLKDVKHTCPKCNAYLGMYRSKM